MKKKVRFIAFAAVIFILAAAVCFGGGRSDGGEGDPDIISILRGIIGGGGNDTSASGSGAAGGIPLPAARGRLTITGIPSNLNGKYAMLSAGTIGPNDVLVGFDGITGSEANASLALSRIANGRVSIPVYLSRNSGNLIAYQGNDTAETLTIVVLNESPVTQSSSANMVNYLAIMTSSSVTFSGGNRELTWSGMLLR